MAKIRNSRLYRIARPGLKQIALKTGLHAAVGSAATRRLTYSEHRVKPILKDTVFFEAYAGKGILCNPAAIFDELLRDPTYRHLTLVWAVADVKAVSAEYRERHPHGPSVKFVAFKSPAYYRYLARAEYLVNNVTFPHEFNKREDQIYLNTWHGTPLKAMGYLVPNGIHLSRNVIRNFIHADYLLSSGPYMTDQMFRHSYPIDGIFTGTVLETGNPRVARQLAVAASPPETKRAVLEAAGVEPGPEKRILLYAPTWRGEATFCPDDQSEALRRTMARLNGELAQYSIKVILKPHQLAHRFLADDTGLDGLLVDPAANTNEVLGAVDGVITDYSSIAFDFLAQEAPIFWFTPDLEEYRATHGLIVEPDKQFGRHSETLEDLVAHVAAEFTAVGEQMRTVQAVQWEDARRTYAPHDGTQTVSKLAARVFLGVTHSSIEEVSLRSNKFKVLFYPGGLERNGVTASALTFLQALDPDRFDVTIIKGDRNDAATAEALVQLPAHVRVFSRVGAVAVRRRHLMRWRNVFVARSKALVGDTLEAEYMALESRRMLADIEFDVAVDFSGYTPFWQGVLLNTRASRRIAWQHNDLAQEVEKWVNGVQIHRANLGAVFEMYRYWDAVYSVSDALAELNRQNLAGYLEGVTVGAVPNMIDAEALRRESTLPEISPESTEDEIATAARRNQLRRSLDPHASTPFVFMTAGRFSPEKNHRRLLEAFALVHRAEPNTALVICGTGPLFDETVTLAQDLGISAAVSFPGHVYDIPFLLKQVDRFVLSSDHEGQPVTVLEALALEVPVIVTAFDSVGGLPETDAIEVCARDVSALAKAMTAAVRATGPSPVFEMERYNQDALQAFEAALRGN